MDNETFKGIMQLSLNNLLKKFCNGITHESSGPILLEKKAELLKKLEQMAQNQLKQIENHFKCNFFYFEPNPLTTIEFLKRVFELSLTENKEIIINLIKDNRHRSNFQNKSEELNQCINYFKSLENNSEKIVEIKDKKIIILKNDENRNIENASKESNSKKQKTNNNNN